MERIREAIKLAKQARGNTTPRDVLGTGQVMSNTRPDVAEVSHEPYQGSALPIVATDRKHLEDNRIVGHLNDNLSIIPYEILRTKIVQEMTTQKWSVLMITSPTQGCGKTVTAINLALSMAKLPGRVVYLVDLDLRKPAVAAYLGLPKMPDFNDYLGGKVGADETLFNIDVAGEKLTIAVNRETTRNSAEVMASQPVAEFLNYLKQRHEQAIIIVDLPPLLVSDDVMAVLPLADCCLLTVAENLSTSHDIVKSDELLAGTNFLGCVLNKSSEVNKDHYY